MAQHRRSVSVPPSMADMAELGNRKTNAKCIMHFGGPKPTRGAQSRIAFFVFSNFYYHTQENLNYHAKATCLHRYSSTRRAL